MKKLIFALIALACFISAQSQNYVTIPDDYFAFFLRSHFPDAMHGNQLDTTSMDIKTVTKLDVFPDIEDLTGIQYFISLEELNCPFNDLTTLPVLPPKLIRLDCSVNDITSLPELPNSLRVLECFRNELTQLPELPDSLEECSCSNNRLTSLPDLPNSLKELACQSNYLDSLPVLPEKLVSLYCAGNHLTALPRLPDSLEYLYCSVNRLTVLPALPKALKRLDCGTNWLTSLPDLPNSLTHLDCQGAGSQSSMASNRIKVLPTLPNSLQYLVCRGNRLTELPELPNTLTLLKCNKNSISCFPVFPNSLVDPSSFSIGGNPFTCLPNYVAAMDAETLAIPLCSDDDVINNPNGCGSFHGIIGSVFNDINDDCTMDDADIKPGNVHLMLYNEREELIRQTYSAVNGVYNFADLKGTFTVRVDTIGVPFAITCADPGIDSTVTLTQANPVAASIDFGINCAPGFDLGVKSVVEQGLIFPGEQHRVRIVAGDLSAWEQLHCAEGVGGQVQVTVDGPVSYYGPLDGALVPNVDENVLTYEIPNFGDIDILRAFNLVFTTKTSARESDTICVQVEIAVTEQENNVANNYYDYCYKVVNSFDPNSKEVFPVNVEPGYDDYFTYTIHFQNTGSANAINISLKDTLSSLLDLSSFQVSAYSHYNTVSLNKNALTVSFPNIQLPDSTSNAEGSQGYFQYRIKPLSGLAEGTAIENRAFIYFDYNDPVETNTTINLFQTPVLVANENLLGTSARIYPNPTSSRLTIELPDFNGQQNEISFCNLMGQQVYRKTAAFDGPYTLHVGNLADGVYLLSVRNINGEYRSKFVIKR